MKGRLYLFFLSYVGSVFPLVIASCRFCQCVKTSVICCKHSVFILRASQQVPLKKKASSTQPWVLSHDPGGSFCLLLHNACGKEASYERTLHSQHTRYNTFSLLQTFPPSPRLYKDNFFSKGNLITLNREISWIFRKKLKYTLRHI